MKVKELVAKLLEMDQEASIEVYAEVVNPPENITIKGDDFFTMCIPDEHKKTLDVCKNYKHYLNSKFSNWATRTDKRQIVVTWSKRNKPDWLNI